MSEKRQTPSERYTECEQNTIDMHVDLCLIRLVRDYGDRVRSFDGNLQDTAIDRSLNFMDHYISEFEEHVRYMKSSEHIMARYEKLTGSAPAPIQPTFIEEHKREHTA